MLFLRPTLAFESIVQKSDSVTSTSTVDLLCSTLHIGMQLLMLVVDSKSSASADYLCCEEASHNILIE